MLTTLQTQWLLLLAFISAHPLLAAVIAMTALNIIATVGMAKLPKDSKLWHVCNGILQGITNVLGIVNSIRGVQGKPAIELGKDPETSAPLSATEVTNMEQAARIVPKLVLLVFALGCFFRNTPAYAADFKVGPSCPLFRVGLDVHPVGLAPGLGVQGGLSFGDWSIDGAFFGSLDSLSTQVNGRGSVAIFGCYTPLGACLGPMFDLAASDGSGVFQRFTWKENFGIVASINWEALAQLHFSTAQK